MGDEVREIDHFEIVGVDLLLQLGYAPADLTDIGCGLLSLSEEVFDLLVINHLVDIGDFFGKARIFGFKLLEPAIDALDPCQRLFFGVAI